MTYDEAMRAVLEEPASAWHKDAYGRGVHEVWVYRGNLHLRIEADRDNDGFVNIKDYRMPWVKKFPEGKTESQFFHLLYGKSLVKQYILVSVDEANALLPQPGAGEKAAKVSREDYALASIVNHALGDLELAMTIAGFTVDDES